MPFVIVECLYSLDIRRYEAHECIVLFVASRRIFTSSNPLSPQLNCNNVEESGKVEELLNYHFFCEFNCP